MRLERLDARWIEWMHRNGAGLLRRSLGVLFIWFGAPKLFPGLSPAEDLISRAVGLDPTWFVPFLGLWEIAIGCCLLYRPLLRLGLLLMAGQMVGAILPLFTLPDVAWKAFPVATLEGQYMLKNLVLVAAAIAVGGAEIRPHLAPAR